MDSPQAARGSGAGFVRHPGRLAGWRPLWRSCLRAPLAGRQCPPLSLGEPAGRTIASPRGLRLAARHGEELNDTGGGGTSGPEPGIGFLCSPHRVSQEWAGRRAPGAGWVRAGGPGRTFAWEEGLCVSRSSRRSPLSRAPGAPGGRGRCLLPLPGPGVTRWAWHGGGPAWGAGLQPTGPWQSWAALGAPGWGRYTPSILKPPPQGRAPSHARRRCGLSQEEGPWGRKLGT